MLSIKNQQDFEKVERNGYLAVLHFMADWAPQCAQMNEVMLELEKQVEFKNVTFASIVAEDLPEISQQFNISAVPTFLLFRGGKVIERVEGANPSELTEKVKTQAAKSSLISNEKVNPEEELNNRLKGLINSCECMLFMKGKPDNPKCGFSRTTIELLEKYNADFGSFDILTDDSVRQGLKIYSNWPTYPQLYVKGDLVGGLDILKEMDDQGDFESMLPKVVKLEDRLKELVAKAPLMVFMKGEPEQPRCGFSKQLMAILNESGLKFDSFDILTEEEVRQGLKKFSNWPTYPQIYVNGELVGGLDIIKELQSDGSLLEVLKGTSD